MNNPRKNSISDENLRKEIKALKAQIESLENYLETQSTSSDPNKSVEFLLAEFNELGQFWRHTDARLESGLNLYLTASALIVSGLAYLSQQVTDFRAFFSFVAVVAFALFIGGSILAESIIRTATIKAEYTQGLNLIRRYFIDADKSIKDYLILPTANILKGKNDGTFSTTKTKIPKFLLVVVHIWNSLLLGFVVASTYWLIMPQSNIKFVLGAGIVVALLSFSFLSMAWFRKPKAG